MITKHKINSKDVFITEKHHHNLIPWGYGKQNYGDLILFTLDDHIDTHEPFLSYAYNQQENKIDEHKVKDELDKINYKDILTIKNAIPKLENDEQIKTAIKTNIIEKCFIISYSNSSDSPKSFEEKKYLDNNFIDGNINYPTRPFTYPDTEIYIPENICSVGCKAAPHNDSCRIPHFNQCLESVFWEHKLGIMEEMNSKLINRGVFLRDYILDIDLDYFHTRESISPSDANIFYSIINKSKFITITKEEDFIQEWARVCKYDENLEVDYLLEKLLKHIDYATK